MPSPATPALSMFQSILLSLGKSILVHKRSDTKKCFKYIFYVRIKQLFIIIYVNVIVKRVYPHKANNNILFRYGKIPESQFSVPWSSLRWSNWAFKSPATINCAVNKSKQFAILKIWIFTRTSMPQLRQNDRERAESLIPAGMTHRAVADHFNVSISRIMILLQQTGRTNDRPGNLDRTSVM